LAGVLASAGRCVLAEDRENPLLWLGKRLKASKARRASLASFEKKSGTSAEAEKDLTDKKTALEDKHQAERDEAWTEAGTAAAAAASGEAVSGDADSEDQTPEDDGDLESGASDGALMMDTLLTPASTALDDMKSERATETGDTVSKVSGVAETSPSDAGPAQEGELSAYDDAVAFVGDGELTPEDVLLRGVGPTSDAVETVEMAERADQVIGEMEAITGVDPAAAGDLAAGIEAGGLPGGIDLPSPEESLSLDRDAPDPRAGDLEGYAITPGEGDDDGSGGTGGRDTPTFRGADPRLASTPAPVPYPNVGTGSGSGGSGSGSSTSGGSDVSGSSGDESGSGGGGAISQETGPPASMSPAPSFSIDASGGLVITPAPSTTGDGDSDSADGGDEKPPDDTTTTPDPEGGDGGLVGQDIPAIAAEDPLETDVYETLIDPGDPDSGVETGDRVLNIDPDEVLAGQLDPYITPHPDDDGSDGEDIFEVGGDPLDIDLHDTLVDPPDVLLGEGTLGDAGELGAGGPDEIDEDGSEDVDGEF
jgi:hypothetical protein